MSLQIRPGPQAFQKRDLENRYLRSVLILSSGITLLLSSRCQPMECITWSAIGAIIAILAFPALFNFWERASLAAKSLEFSDEGLRITEGKSCVLLPYSTITFLSLLNNSQGIPKRLHLKATSSGIWDLSDFSDLETIHRELKSRTPGIQIHVREAEQVLSSESTYLLLIAILSIAAASCVFLFDFELRKVFVPFRREGAILIVGFCGLLFARRAIRIGGVPGYSQIAFFAIWVVLILFGID